MNIWKRNRQRKEQERDDWMATIQGWQAQRYACVHCHDTHKCPTCQGKGCIDCDYMEWFPGAHTCPHCLGRMR